MTALAVMPYCERSRTPIWILILPCAVTCLGQVFDTASSVRVLVDKELTGLDRTDCHPRRNAASFAIALADILNGRIPAAGHADFRRAQPTPGLRLRRHQPFTSTPG